MDLTEHKAHFLRIGRPSKAAGETKSDRGSPSVLRRGSALNGESRAPGREQAPVDPSRVNTYNSAPTSATKTNE